MKNFIALVCLCGLILGLYSVYCQGNSLDRRALSQQTTIALQPPFTFHSVVNVSSANYSVPDSFIVCCLRSRCEGTIYISTPYNDSVPLYSTTYDVFPIRVTKVYKLGTSDSCLNNSITLDGIKKSGN